MLSRRRGRVLAPQQTLDTDATTKMKPRVLIVAAPFGFGPASKALSVANGLSKAAEITINVGGDAFQFVDSYREKSVKCVEGKFSNVYQDGDSLRSFAMIVSINHVPALECLNDFGLLDRTVFVDSLFPWRHANNDQFLPAGLRAYLVQDYPDLDDVFADDSGANIEVVSPILWANEKNNHKLARNGILLHLGGMTSPLAKWREIERYVRDLVGLALVAAKKEHKMLTVIGNEVLRELESFGRCQSRSICGVDSFSRTVDNNAGDWRHI